MFTKPQPPAQEKIKVLVYNTGLRQSIWKDAILIKQDDNKSECRLLSGLSVMVNNDCIKFLK